MTDSTVSAVSAAGAATGRRTPLVFPSRVKPDLPPRPASPPWRILIADDEPDVHSVTRMLLKDFSFEGRGLEFIGAESATMACSILKAQPDIAVVLLDVVMESEHAGLEAVRAIRHDLNNTMVRIILRTGQPGYAPEKQVVEDFDINDYREKTELTAQKLTTAMISALRAYRDLSKLEVNRRGLEQIVGAAGKLFEHQSLTSFSGNVLAQLTALLSYRHGGLLADGSGRLAVAGLVASRRGGGFELLAGTGPYAVPGGDCSAAALSPELQQRIAAAFDLGQPQFGRCDFIGSFRSSTQQEHVVYIESIYPLEDVDTSLLKVFAANLGFAFENVCLNRELSETSAEIVQTLSDVVETRSVDTSRHTLRVGRCALLLGRMLGLPDAALDTLRLVAPMHDLGKVGIPDALLNKPGRLTAEEYACVKAHTTIGYNILKGSKRRLLTAAAQVCLQHHERWDGGGYPYGLKGREIDILGRIVGLVDVFDAISNERPYKHAWPVNQVLEYIEKERGGQFDPELVDLFVNNFDAFLAQVAGEVDEE